MCGGWARFADQVDVVHCVRVAAQEDLLTKAEYQVVVVVVAQMLLDVYPIRGTVEFGVKTVYANAFHVAQSISNEGIRQPHNNVLPRHRTVPIEA